MQLTPSPAGRKKFILNIRIRSDISFNYSTTIAKKPFLFGTIVIKWFITLTWFKTDLLNFYLIWYEIEYPIYQPLYMEFSQIWSNFPNTQFSLGIVTMPHEAFSFLNPGSGRFTQVLIFQTIIFVKKLKNCRNPSWISAEIPKTLP